MGDSIICALNTTSLSDTLSGGSWTSATTSVATVDGSAGVVTGVFSDYVVATSVISYTMPTGCQVTETITVNPIPSVISSVTGNHDCAGLSMTLTNTQEGGVWSSSDATIGSIDPVSGVFTGIMAGSVTLSYSFATGCNTRFAATVDPLPAAIAGAGAVCTSLTTTLTNDSLAGSWTSGNVGIAIIDPSSGVVTGLSAGSATITYTLPTSCIATTQFTVNPTPYSNNSIHDFAICNSQPFSYVDSPVVFGTTDTWYRATVAGISNPAMVMAGDIYDTLTNTSPYPLTVIYVDTLQANGCYNTQNITLTVNPTPLITVSSLPFAQCDSFLFVDTAHSLTPGTSYIWTRASLTGITPDINSGEDSTIGEYLHNSTPFPIGVTYVYTLTANGCSNVQNVIDTVYPTPQLTVFNTTATVCDDQPFAYSDSSTTPGTVINWIRNTVPGISNAFGSGTGDVHDTLVNTTPLPIAVTYINTLHANGCVNTGNVVVTVNPLPQLLGNLTQPAQCDNQVFRFTDTSATPGTTYSWVRPSIAGIVGSSNGTTSSPDETLVNDTTIQVKVVYTYTLVANGCPNTQQVTLTVNPIPKLSTTLTPAAICDSATFSYAPHSLTPTAGFTWYRPYVSGILEIAASGTNNPNETLINTTNFDVVDSYQYTTTAYGCSDTQQVSVTVHPSPVLTSVVTDQVCSGSPFSFTPSSFTQSQTTVAFAWARKPLSAITPATGAGTDLISETLTSSDTIPVIVTYMYSLTANGCPAHNEAIAVTVNPTPAIPQITTHTPSSICSNTLYQNFGTNIPPTPTDHYSWTVSNGDLVAVGHDADYCIVSFPGSGDASVTLTATKDATGCLSETTYPLTLGTSTSSNPVVIYTSGEFICLLNNVSSYQWGYDDLGSLDSSEISGQIDQSYSNSSPEFSTRAYWVMTTDRTTGCVKKGYYTIPTGVTNINESAAMTEIKVFPNPANTLVNVDITTTADGSMEVELFNMLGQKLNTVPVTDHRARFDVSNLAAGIYLVDCYRDGVKIGTARFVKN